MTVTHLDLAMQQNASFIRTFAVTADTDGSPKLAAAGDPAMDLTGWSARMQVRNQYISMGGRVVIDASTANTGIAIDGPNGLLHVNIHGGATIYLDWGVIGKYDLLLYKPTGETYRLIQGSVSIDRGVTAGAWGL